MSDRGRVPMLVSLVALTLMTLAISAQVAQGGSNGLIGKVDPNETVILMGNVHPLARPEFDIGPADASLPMKRMILTLRPDPVRQAELDGLLARQQDPLSPDYHRWLTPEEFGIRFGPSETDLATIQSWLCSAGLTIDEVAKGRLSINFSGTVADVEKAFSTRIHDFRVEGEVRRANVTDPSIPRALAPVVTGVVSLNSFPKKALHTPPRLVNSSGIQPDYSGGGQHYLAPGDFAIIYNANPLYASGTNGSGVTVAIVGRTHPSTAVSDWNSFRSNFGLPYNPPNIILNGPDPGDQGPGEDGEANLDVEWSGAVAPNATIDFVCSASTYSTDGVDLSAQYIVNNNLAPVMSTSFGLCESYLGSGNAFYNNLWAQAAAQGITSFVSSGDNGVAGCDSASSSSGTGRAVNGLASTPYNVGVGGTQFMDSSSPSTYWSSNNNPSTMASALSYIPEEAWNESGATSDCPAGDTCSDLWAGSGGASSLYSKPSWQVAPGVPGDNARDVPDVALTSATHDGYLVVQTGKLYVFGGTSAASPSFAGLMALIVQKTGQRQGNANTLLYQIGNAQYGHGGSVVFHDTTVGNNTVPGVTGFSCGVGYDQATGLGSVDANALVGAFSSGSCPSITLSPSSLPGGTKGTAYSQTISASGGTAPYSFAVTGGSLPPGLTLSSSGSLSGVPTTGGTFNFTATATDSASCTGSGSYSVTITVAPPNPQTGQKLGSPFRIVFQGSNLQYGIQVYIGSSSTPWSSLVWKNTGKIVLTGGASLKAAVPKGVVTLFTFVNPDGGTWSGTWYW